MVLTQTLKRVKLKGKSGAIVRELYLRDDISCFSPLCELCCSINQGKATLLDKEATHYAIPCLDVLTNFFEIFELPETKGLIILQSVASKIMQTSGHRAGKRLVKISKDIRRGSVVFLNEICRKSHVERNPADSFEEWLNKCCVRAAEFYADHLHNNIPIVLVTENAEILKSMVENEAIKVYSMEEYLKTFWGNETSLLQLFESLKLAISSGTVKDLSRSYDNYLPVDVLESGIKGGRFFKGYLRVNKHHASEEAFVTSSKAVVKDSGDIYIHGMIDRNRAIHGDEVVVEVLPREQWKARCMKLQDDTSEAKEQDKEEDMSSNMILPTGKVVGVLERCWRNYIATLPEEEEECSSTKSKERILVVPYDYRIPKIRIATKQVDVLRNKRVVVRVDNWEKDSQYPNGHLVQTLGEIGDLETEVQSLLIEHDVFSREFPQNVIGELPLCTKENPWCMDENEVIQRKDLRQSHLIFSIDPKGCEDVDDALSVRTLPNGNVELGVHIADVTFFVPEMSLVDLEARSRSTSVYLPDRRYDMLPHVLSGNLCSLLGNVDRYAVSVLWELDSNFNVLSTWYGRTVINSKYQLCYEVAQDILHGASIKDVISEIPELQILDGDILNSKFEELKNALINLYLTANAIRNDRLGAGGLELSSVNMKFEIDRSLPSIISDIKSAKELAIHKTVAECMIFANHWVAKKINDAFPQHAVLRRHPNPREADLVELQKLAASKGFELDIHSNKNLASSLEKAVDNDDPTINQILRVLTTQTMNQATYCCTDCYSVPELYHYGLGLDKYTHFTSPIRRYADILVHRLLLAAVNGAKKSLDLESNEIEEICHHMNFKHRAAQDLEKDAQQLFLTFYFDELSLKENSAPCTVDAVIYALRTNGVLVFIPKYGIKGAVCLCNKEKRVAVVRDQVEWCEGTLTSDQSCLIVHCNGMQQKYRIFDHLTVNVKVSKSRSHQPKVVLDLVNNKPYTQDWEDFVKVKPDIFSLRPELKDHGNGMKVIADNRSSTEEPKEFDLYMFLQKIRALTLRSKETEDEDS